MEKNRPVYYGDYEYDDLPSTPVSLLCASLLLMFGFALGWLIRGEPNVRKIQAEAFQTGYQSAMQEAGQSASVN